MYRYQVWAGSKHSPFASQKAIVKAKLLTGTLRLQANRAKFNSHEVDPTCKLCEGGPENEQHFVLECPVLEEKRKPYKEKNKIHPRTNVKSRTIGRNNKQQWRTSPTIPGLYNYVR